MSRKYAVERPIATLPLWGEMLRRRMLMGIELELTARCHNDCTHCYINLPAADPEAKRRELTVEEIGRIAQEATQLGAIYCVITGGEPLLRPDFAEIYRLIKGKGMLVSLFTTACLVTPETVRLFQELPPREVEVTVYGVTEETYEAVTRRRGSFRAFERGLRLLQDGGIPVRLKAMAIRSNFHEMGAIADFCREKTKDYFRYDHQLHLRYDRDPERNGVIASERLSVEQVAALEGPDEAKKSALRKVCGSSGTVGAQDESAQLLFRCGAGEGLVTIGWDASMKLCSSLMHPDTVYDLRRGSLAEAWNSFVPGVREMKSAAVEYVNGCSSCALANLCTWCPAHAFLETGSLDRHVPSFCGVAEKRAEFVSLSEDGPSARPARSV